jgi:transcriptional antiterminator NusG
MTTHVHKLIPEVLPSDFSATLPSFIRPLWEDSSSGPWYALQTRYRFEIRVATQLEGKGVETFLPALNESHRWTDRQKTVSLPLFAGYVFVRLSLTSPARTEVLRTEGVVGFVKASREVSPIPARQIDDLRRLLAQKLPCALRAFLQVGQRVRIRGGCLDGLEGILAESRQKTLIISIECIQRSIAVTIEGYELELV